MCPVDLQAKKIASDRLRCNSRACDLRNGRQVAGQRRILITISSRIRRDVDTFRTWYYIHRATPLRQAYARPSARTTMKKVISKNPKKLNCLKMIAQEMMKRSEERRVGKECKYRR